MSNGSLGGFDWEGFNDTFRRIAEEARRQMQAALPALAEASRVQEQMAQIARTALRNVDTSGLKALAQKLREQLPPNWDRFSDYEPLAEFARSEGIPVVWVPRAEVLADLLAAEDADARLCVLMDREAEILDDCDVVLRDVVREDLLPPARLAGQAIAAFHDGHHASAQALAVVVCESILTEHVAAKRSYKALAKAVDTDIDELAFSEIRTAFALLPVACFYATWYREDGVPPPERLSRHVTVHHAFEEHFTRANAILSVMLLASILRDLQEVLEPLRR